MKKIIFALLLSVVVITAAPSVASAAWWNPFSWFKKATPVSSVTAVQNVSTEAIPAPSSTATPAASSLEQKIKNVLGKNSSDVSLAQCIKNSGALFFGASWCPHCQAQKALFGTHAAELPYVECSPQGSQGQADICTKNNITAYPTWKFKDGTQVLGAMTLADLAKKTDCPLK